MSPHTSTRHKGREALFSWARHGGFDGLHHHSRKNRGNSGNKHKESSNGAGYPMVASGNKVGTEWEQSENSST